MSVFLIARGGEWYGWYGGCEVAKKPCLGHPISNHDAHTVVSGTLVGHRVIESKPRSLLPNWNPPLVLLFQSLLFKMPLRKSHRLAFNT